MTPAAHYLAAALAATFALPAARYAAFSLACVDAARSHNVSACDVAALAIVDGDAPADVARAFVAARRRCHSRGLAVAGMRGGCRDVAQRGRATRVLGLSARLCATAAGVGP
jgi:hypothetical protein